MKNVLTHSPLASEPEVDALRRAPGLHDPWLARSLGELRFDDSCGCLITVRQDKALTEDFTTLARRRLAFELGRFGARVRSITVRLRDVNGPRGGIDKQCLVTIRLIAPPHEIVITEVDASAGVAVDRAADRAGRAVARVVDAIRDAVRVRGGNGKSR